MKWSDTYGAAWKLRQLLAVQQYLEKDINGFEKTMEQLKERTKDRVDCIPDLDYINSTAEKLSKTDEKEERSLLLSKFYKNLESEFESIYGLTGCMGMFISVKFSTGGIWMPKSGLEALTSFEQCALKVTSKSFFDNTIYEKYETNHTRAKNLVLNTKKDSII
jgi:hypothetical protein